MHSFHLSPDKWVEPYTLAGAEAHHLAKVMRIRLNEQVRLFDGQGREGVFLVTEILRHTVVLGPVDVRVHPPRARSTVLALAWAKGLRRSWLLEKAVELEASALWFWRAEHSQGHIPDDVKQTWQAQCVAGAKQSRNPWLPELTVVPGGVTALAARAKEFERAFVLWEDQVEGRLISVEELREPASALFVAGPEGGFSTKEVAQLRQAGCEPVSLGPRVLRWETAALLCLGLRFWASIPDNP